VHDTLGNAAYCEAKLETLDALRDTFLRRNMDTLIASIRGMPAAHPVMMPQVH